ncbi:hypothetical protein PCANC_28261 [Puccinia coronata f. sp. avenae]|uniref:Uncharacterized protein n=1 Tax=Puccinia coronata f. sp. avenae TaxID=200324 RepID=A0A2N5TDP4_9BASI|nr:hypothetical protein PCANC_28261 [Puccinia coronata f. sp. avenae]
MTQPNIMGALVYGLISIRTNQACTAGINRSNTAARAVLEQPCSTGVRTDTVRPKREPTGRTDLSDRSRLVLCNRSQELIGQACPTRRQVLRSDSACPTTGRTRLFEHRSNCRVRPVNAGSAGQRHWLQTWETLPQIKMEPTTYVILLGRTMSNNFPQDIVQGMVQLGEFIKNIIDTSNGKVNGNAPSLDMLYNQIHLALSVTGAMPGNWSQLSPCVKLALNKVKPKNPWTSAP